MIRSQFLASLGASSVALTNSTFTSTISIAVVGPFSGPARQLGLQLQSGAQGAVDEYNNYTAALSTSSTAYQIRTFDDQNSIASAVLQAQFATGDSTIVGAVGHISADATLQAIPTYGNAQMPLIIPASTDDRLTATTYHNVFRLATKDSDEGAIFARVIAKQFRPKVPYVFVQDADYGADVANGFIDMMSQLKIVTPYQQFSYATPDFPAVVTKAIAANMDFAFLAGTVGDMGPIVGVLRDKGYTGPIGASQGFFDPRTTKLGPAANDILVSSSMPYLTLAPTSVRALNDYQAHRGQITPLAAFGYAAVQVIISQMQRSGATVRNTVLNAIQTGLPTDTLVGTFSFAATGDSIDPQLYFYTMRDGKFAYAHEAHPSSFMLK